MELSNSKAELSRMTSLVLSNRAGWPGARVHRAMTKYPCKQKINEVRRGCAWVYSGLLCSIIPALRMVPWNAIFWYRRLEPDRRNHVH